MSDVSHIGTIVRLTASNTFPTGFTLSSFPGDVDPFDMADIVIAEAEMGTNGDIYTWSSANPIEVDLSLIPNTADAINMAVLFEQNRPQKNKGTALDEIKVVRMTPDGAQLTLGKGKILSGPPAMSQGSNGRLKTPTYKMAFGTMSLKQPSVSF